MRGDGLFKQITLGVVLAAVLLPAPARAQWTVFDPANYKIQIKKQIDDLNRWMQTVNQYWPHGARRRIGSRTAQANGQPTRAHHL